MVLPLEEERGDRGITPRQRLIFCFMPHVMKCSHPPDWRDGCLLLLEMRETDDTAATAGRQAKCAQNAKKVSQGKKGRYTEGSQWSGVQRQGTKVRKCCRGKTAMCGVEGRGMHNNVLLKHI